ncbi:MAG: serine hydrolase [Henriciella sp.]|nr:serine hydrolase [Henriciella sp.]
MRINPKGKLKSANPCAGRDPSTAITSRMNVKAHKWIAAVSGVCGVLFLGFTATAQPLFPLQSHPADTAWPTQQWDEGSMPAETAPVVDALITKALSTEKEELMGETRAIIVIHEGCLVAEAYRDGFGPDTKQISWSMAKSITQALVGRAVQLGYIDDIDAPMPVPFEADDPRSQITWRHWLTMTDGLDYKEVNAPSFAENDVVNMMYGRGKFDVLAYADAELPMIHTPGEVWNYSTAGYHLIGRALQRTFFDWISDEIILESMNDTAIPRADSVMSEILQKYHFATFGMDAQPEFDTSGTFLGGSLVWASARDFAKFGYLYLRDGVWEGERLLPEGWVDFARTKSPADNVNVYGAGWWIMANGEPRSHAQSANTLPWDAFHAGGHEGQTIWIVPSKDLVIVRLGLMSNAAENWEALYEWNQEIARAFPDVEVSRASESESAPESEPILP